MDDKMYSITEKDFKLIHDNSMRILKEIGILFNDEETIRIFKDHGLKVEGKTVFFKEKNVRNALEAAPAQFTVAARNPKNNVQIGQGRSIFVPGYGAPF
ncbi:MAG: trimethylamine methyltransferase family protein, partial [Spirochaetota bacterium]